MARQSSAGLTFGGIMKVIAEIGSNWKTLDDCVRSVRAAKAAGADAIKFQEFSTLDLYGPLHSTTGGLSPDVDRIAMECSLLGIEFMCTAFSPDGYDRIDEYVKTHKVASSEITHIDILKRINEYKKPVYLSTGGANYDEIGRARQTLKDCKVTLMFCVAEYPAKVIDFRHLEDMQKHYGGLVEYGYSDHSIDVLNVPVIAKKHGCSVIEKHVNFCNYTDTPDAPHSINGEELSMMVRLLKEALPIKETFRANPHKRIKTFLGYYRPYPK